MIYHKYEHKLSKNLDFKLFADGDKKYKKSERNMTIFAEKNSKEHITFARSSVVFIMTIKL